MATATLTDGPAVQLTFPWALPKAEEESTIVAERRPRSAAGRRAAAARPSGSGIVARVTVERHSTASPIAKVATAESAIAESPIAKSPIARRPVAKVQSSATVEPPVAAAATCECVDSVQEALHGDRIGKPVRIGAVMFRLLKRYGITDEEIAEGVAAYNAKRAGLA